MCLLWSRHSEEVGVAGVGGEKGRVFEVRLGGSLPQWDEKLPKELWAEEGHDQDGAKCVGRTFWSVHYSCCACCWFPQGQLPTFWDCLSRTFLNGTSGLSLSTLYLLILTTDELSPTSPASASRLLPSGWAWTLLPLSIGLSWWCYFTRPIDDCGLHSRLIMCGVESLGPGTNR